MREGRQAEQERVASCSLLMEGTPEGAVKKVYSVCRARRSV